MAHIYCNKNIIVRILFTVNKSEPPQPCIFKISDLKIILHTKGKLRFLFAGLPQIKCDIKNQVSF